MRKPFFYGWVVVFACMILAAASTGLLSYLNPLFIQPVTEAFGISRASFMIYQTFSTTATVICMPIFSSIYHRLPMKAMILAGACCGAASHLYSSMASGVTAFYVSGVLAGTATCLYGSIPIAILTSNWFHEKKGVATGLAFAGTGAASALLSPIMARVIEELGWRTGYRIIAVLIMCAVTPVTLLLIRVTPEEMGLTPYGQRLQEHGAPEKQGFSRKQVFSTRSFWLFALGIFLIGAVTAPAQQQLVAYWSEAGNSAAFAASLYSLVMLTAIFSKIFLGSIYDRTSVAKGTLAVGALAVLSFVGLLLFPRGYAAAIPAVLFGVTVSIQVLVGTYVVNRLFGDREYPFVYGIITPVLYGGVAVGSPLSASIYDRFGNYRLLWAACAVVFAAAVCLVVIADSVSLREYRRMLGIERK